MCVVPSRFPRLTIAAGRRDAAAALKLKWRLFHSQGGGTVCEVAGFRFLHWPAECAQIYVAVPCLVLWCFIYLFCIHIVCIIFYSFDRIFSSAAGGSVCDDDDDEHTNKSTKRCIFSSHQHTM